MQKLTSANWRYGFASRWIDADLMKRAFEWDVQASGQLILSEPILVVTRIAQAFDTLGVGYVVGDRSRAQSIVFLELRKASTSLPT